MTDDNQATRDRLNEQLSKEINQLEEENRQLRKQLTTATGIIHDMMQCHRLNDHIGERARHFINANKRG